MMGLKEFGELETKYLKEKEKRDRYDRVKRQLDKVQVAKMADGEIYDIVCYLSLSEKQKRKVADFLEQMFKEEIQELREDKSE